MQLLRVKLSCLIHVHKVTNRGLDDPSSLDDYLERFVIEQVAPNQWTLHGEVYSQTSARKRSIPAATLTTRQPNDASEIKGLALEHVRQFVREAFGLDSKALLTWRIRQGWVDAN